MAGERFVQFSSNKFINTNMSIHPYGSSLSHLSVEDKQDVELAQLLLAAAEKVACHQFDRGLRLLDTCQWISSSQGTPVQRTVFYFAEALQERIVKETGRSDKKQTYADACVMRNILAFVAMHQELPFFQVLHFTAVQTILESVRTKSKVHVVDFQILTGVQWPGLMQAIAEQKMSCPGGYLKITSIEMSNSHESERTGELLKSFARYLKLPFSYRVVHLSDIKDLREEDLEIDPGEEAVAVHFPFMLRTLISKPACLKNLMGVMQKMKPCVMVVSEAEANHNSPSFVSRFIEALFFYGALFDSLEESMARDDKNRTAIETGVFRTGIRNIVSTEGCERVTRSVSINVWRAFFTRFGMIELELSTASIYQASLIVKHFSSGKSCTLDVGTKCLIVGWKGTPLFSLSAWKFH
ncbi:DELLA protein RGA-like [Andrographis paniculata]|uniref:DELLA protein RGA-like n=1 Tax=Andrographis paniculata TaxID=175694 RepID=UPI0021E8D5D2|nr:DELLA protein RGA-like [Andrographis paniculata]